jgi:hypothetical protein
MAYSLASTVQSVIGNKRMVTGILTTDAASGAVDTGLSVIESVAIACKSANSGGAKFKINLNSGTTALNGSLFASSTTSGDDFYVTVIGR